MSLNCINYKSLLKCIAYYYMFRIIIISYLFINVFVFLDNCNGNIETINELVKEKEVKGMS